MKHIHKLTLFLFYNIHLTQKEVTFRCEREGRVQLIHMSVCETLRYGRCLNSDRKELQRETNLIVVFISLSERSGRNTANLQFYSQLHAKQIRSTHSNAPRHKEHWLSSLINERDIASISVTV